MQPLFPCQEGGDRWRAGTENLSGAPYSQVRITFVSQIFTGLAPELSALALSWQD